MKIDRIYLGTWLPRTTIHLNEIYYFFKNAVGGDLEKDKLNSLRSGLKVQNLVYKNSPTFSSLKFSSGDIEVTITEDGIISLMSASVKNIDDAIKKIEGYYTDQLGPALSYLFSRGAPLPQTLLNIKEVYPKILVGQKLVSKDIGRYLTDHNDELLTKISLKKLAIFYGEESEFIDFANIQTKQNYDNSFDQLLIGSIFIRSYSSLLERYLQLHRSVWTEISLIRENKNLHYSDFTSIRNKVLSILKTISFVRSILHQMNDILSLRSEFTSAKMKQKLLAIGLNSYTTLEKSNQYLDNLWKMTADYGDSTMKLYTSLLEENAQREIRLLQQIAIAGMLAGFFGMNIAFPWEERWLEIYPSSIAVVGIMVVALGAFSILIKKMILHRRFPVL